MNRRNNSSMNLTIRIMMCWLSRFQKARSLCSSQKDQVRMAKKKTIPWLDRSKWTSRIAASVWRKSIRCPLTNSSRRARGKARSDCRTWGTPALWILGCNACQIQLNWPSISYMDSTRKISILTTRLALEVVWRKHIRLCSRTCGSPKMRERHRMTWNGCWERR